MATDSATIERHEARRIVRQFFGIFGDYDQVNHRLAMRVILESLTPDDLAALETFAGLIKERARANVV